MSTTNQPHATSFEPAEQIVPLLSRPEMFERLVDRLPDPLAIESLTYWGFLRGLYPREKAVHVVVDALRGLAHKDQERRATDADAPERVAGTTAGIHAASALVGPTLMAAHVSRCSTPSSLTRLHIVMSVSLTPYGR